MAERSNLRRTGTSTVAVGLTLFAVIAVLVFTGASAGLDAAVHHVVVTGRVPALEWSVLALSTVFGVGVESVLVATVAVLFWLTGRRRSALLLIAAMVLTVAVSTAGKYLGGRARPDPTLWIGPAETSPSFPSGHTICAAAFALIAGYLWWRMRPTRVRCALWLTGAILVIVLVAFSRLYLGVHWLSDTAGSVALAVAVLGVVLIVDSRWGDDAVGRPQGSAT